MGAAQLQEIADKLPLEAAQRLFKLVGDEEAWALLQVWLQIRNWAFRQTVTVPTETCLVSLGCMASWVTEAPSPSRAAGLILCCKCTHHLQCTQQHPNTKLDASCDWEGNVTAHTVCSRARQASVQKHQQSS